MDLLLRQHDGLSWWKKFWLGLHVAGCRSCRERQEELKAVSKVFAECVGGSVPSGGYLVVKPSRRMPWRTAVVVALLLVTLGALAAVWYESTDHPLPLPATAEDCKPSGLNVPDKTGKPKPFIKQKVAAPKQ